MSHRSAPSIIERGVQVRSGKEQAFLHWVNGQFVLSVEEAGQATELVVKNSRGGGLDVDVQGNLSIGGGGSLTLGGAAYGPTGTATTLDVANRRFNLLNATELGGEQWLACGDLDVKDGYLFVHQNDLGNAGFIAIHDLNADPLNPPLVTRITTANDPSGIKILGDRLWIANGTSGRIEIYDVKNPANPVQVGTQSVPNFVSATMARWEDYVFTAVSQNQIRAIKLGDENLLTSNNLSITLSGSPTVNGLAVWDDMLIVPRADNSIEFWDLRPTAANPSASITSPALVLQATPSTGGVIFRDVLVRDQWLFASLADINSDGDIVVVFDMQFLRDGSPSLPELARIAAAPGADANTSDILSEVFFKPLIYGNTMVHTTGAGVSLYDISNINNVSGTLYAVPELLGRGRTNPVIWKNHLYIGCGADDVLPLDPMGWVAIPLSGGFFEATSSVVGTQYADHLEVRRDACFGEGAYFEGPADFHSLVRMRGKVTPFTESQIHTPSLSTSTTFVAYPGALLTVTGAGGITATTDDAETLFRPNVLVDADDAFTMWVSNTSAGTATIAGGSGVTVVGAAVIPAASSALLRFRGTDNTIGSEAVSVYVVLTGTGAGGGAVQGTDATYDFRPTSEGVIAATTARGEYSVDLQLNRNGGAQVASGPGSFLLGGQRNTASGTRSGVAAGETCTASNEAGVIFGSRFTNVMGTFCSAVSASTSAVAGNRCGVFASDSATVSGGSNNALLGTSSCTAAGNRSGAFASTSSTTDNGSNQACIACNNSDCDGDNENVVLASAYSVIEASTDASACIATQFASVGGLCNVGACGGPTLTGQYNFGTQSANSNGYDYCVLFGGAATADHQLAATKTGGYFFDSSATVGVAIPAGRGGVVRRNPGLTETSGASATLSVVPDGTHTFAGAGTYTGTFPTAAAIVGAGDLTRVDDVLKFTIVNKSSNALTIASASGVTIYGPGSIAAGYVSTATVRATNVTGASEAVEVYLST